ncbi:helix-turn-helix domain-containing protein [Mycobacterium avium]
MFAKGCFCLPKFWGIVGRMETAPRWDRLANYVQEFRAMRGMSQKAVAANGGPSDTTLGKIEAGAWRPKRGVDRTLEKLDRGLGWEPGSASRVLAGGEPTIRADTARLARLLRAKAKPLEDRTPDEQELVERSEQERRRASEAVQRSMAEEALAELVDLGRELAERKHDDDVSAYVRRVESAVVLVMGIDNLAEALEYRRERKTIARATEAGLLDELLAEVDRLRVSGIVGRELQRRVEAWLDAIIPRTDIAHVRDADVFMSNDVPRGGAANDVDDLLSKLDDSVKTRAAASQGNPARRAEGQIAAEELLGHYVEMYLRAVEHQGFAVLVDQAREILGNDLDPGEVVPPEIPDDLYVRYVAARHSSPAQEGSASVHSATGLSKEQADAAAARYRRERAEMVLFDGRIRTAGAAADHIAEAIHRTAPRGYVSPAQAERDAQDRAAERGDSGE